MLYLKCAEEDADRLKFCCHYCKKEVPSDQDVVILETRTARHKNRFDHMINAFTKFDPTLPHLYTIPCSKCVHEKPDVVYMRYDDTQLKYVYLCVHCDHSWISKSVDDVN
jgi:DNA-directed RNA polymerase subunit M/transcription elongation factor TFIIS